MAKKITIKTPVIGEFFSKAELGITKKDFRSNFITARGFKYLFLNIYKGFKYLNELHNDGVVLETRGNIGLPNHGVIDGSKGRFLMIRFYPNGKYLCIGTEEYRVRYDEKRGKIFFQDAVKSGKGGNKAKRPKKA